MFPPKLLMGYHERMAKSADNQLLAAYLVVGDDALKKEAVLKRMRIRLEKLGDLSFNADTFDGESATGEEIIAACQTLPFASEKRLVQVTRAEKLKKADADALVAYLASPAESTVLMLLAEKLAKNTRLYKAVDALGKTAVIDCARPGKRDMTAHVRNMAPTHGITLTDGAAAALVELLGEDTVRIDNELAKIALAGSGNAAVTEEDIRRIVSREVEAKPWDLADALSARDLKRAVSVLAAMPSATPYSLLGICVSRIRELICAKSVMKAGGSKAQIASELKAPEWRVRNLDGWARRYNECELRGALASALACEQEMKSGADPDAAFESWMISVISR